MNYEAHLGFGAVLVLLLLNAGLSDDGGFSRGLDGRLCRGKLIFGFDKRSPCCVKMSIDILHRGNQKNDVSVISLSL